MFLSTDQPCIISKECSIHPFNTLHIPHSLHYFLPDSFQKIRIHFFPFHSTLSVCHLYRANRLALESTPSFNTVYSTLDCGAILSVMVFILYWEKLSTLMFMLSLFQISVFVLLLLLESVSFKKVVGQIFTRVSEFFMFRKVLWYQVPIYMLFSWIEMNLQDLKFPIIDQQIQIYFSSKKIYKFIYLYWYNRASTRSWYFQQFYNQTNQW